MVTIATQLPAFVRSAHWTDNRASACAPKTMHREVPVVGISVPSIDIRTRGGVRFVPGYRTADVIRSVAKGPPV